MERYAVCDDNPLAIDYIETSLTWLILIHIDSHGKVTFEDKIRQKPTWGK